VNESPNRVRPRLSDIRNSRTVKKKGGFFLTGAQTVICIICLITAFALKTYGGEYYQSARAFAKDAYNNSIKKEDITEALKSISGDFPSAEEVFKNQASSTANSSKSTSSKTESSSDMNSSSNATTSSDVGDDNSADAAAAIKTGLKPQTLSYQGEGDQPLEITKVLSGSPPVEKTISMTPYKLSVKPVEPVKGNISSKFCNRINPITNAQSFHTGIDIAAPSGTPIEAAYDGVVEKTGVSEVYGNYVLMDNGGGIETFYGHCGTINVKSNDKISAGTTIASVGSTGMSTGYHLHFEVRINGVYVDPQYCLSE